LTVIYYLALAARYKTAPHDRLLTRTVLAASYLAAYESAIHDLANTEPDFEYIRTPCPSPVPAPAQPHPCDSHISD
jgi:hypothetical protein